MECVLGIFVLGLTIAIAWFPLYSLIFVKVMLIRSTAHPSYCPSALLPIRPTATSDLRIILGLG